MQSSNILFSSFFFFFIAFIDCFSCIYISFTVCRLVNVRFFFLMRDNVLCPVSALEEKATEIKGCCFTNYCVVVVLYLSLFCFLIFSSFLIL